MKRTLIAAILGIAGSIVSSYGQGSVWFSNYSNNNYAGAPVLYGANTGGKVGDPVVGGFNAQLAYFLGTMTDPAGGGLESLSPSLQLLPTVIPNLGGGGLPGETAGQIVQIPSYTSGAITFEFLAFNGTSYDTSTIRGHSAAFTLPSIATGQTLPGHLDGMQSFSVLQVIPEPTTLAVFGLGALGLLGLRRRKA